jgi:type III restriction enzyme
MKPDPRVSRARPARRTARRSARCTVVGCACILFEATRRVVSDLTAAAGGAASDRRRRVLGLQSRHALFPQVFRVVEAYVARKVDWNGAPQAELGLQKYLDRLVERVRDAIEPDTSAGEPPLLPLPNRYKETGTSAEVDFKTTRPCFATAASHVNQVVADTASWEQSAAFRIEQAAQAGIVRFYARNEGMGLVIPYDYMGVDHAYEPDFLVRLAVTRGDLTLMLEVKGFEDDQARAKHAAAKRWIEAVNNWGRLGHWAFHVCRDPHQAT